MEQPYNEANPIGTEVFLNGSANGCDSTVNVNLVFNDCTCPPEVSNENYMGCQGDGYSITLLGTTYNEGNPVGSETYTGGAFSGCDSVVIITMTFNPPSFASLDSSTCQGDPLSITVGNTTFDVNNPIGQDTLFDAAFSGCDSIVTVNLTFIPPSFGTLDSTTCQGDPLSITVGNTTFDVSNPIGQDTLFGAAFSGCDSIVIVNLAFVDCSCPPSFGTLDSTTCQGDPLSITVGNTIFDVNNPIGQDTLFGSAFSGCDSIVIGEPSVY